ncbi:hypothetical protein K469DRAFT_747153 [Zopfia rhizophila CBS 207.26]|uniref:Uncharacterized protein n=1 Tax=Zopfia rhizophila CBS 207.26 TaxID=1314779 RepID=A0A6A6EFB2_9PEZI|nr:hypothetical protein K469DRAFT_747153 [Zopfia rhizophila CBS 207.26]
MAGRREGAQGIEIIYDIFKKRIDNQHRVDYEVKNEIVVGVDGDLTLVPNLITGFDLVGEGTQRLLSLTANNDKVVGSFRNTPSPNTTSKQGVSNEMQLSLDYINRGVQHLADVCSEENRARKLADQRAEKAEHKQFEMKPKHPNQHLIDDMLESIKARDLAERRASEYEKEWMKYREGGSYDRRYRDLAERRVDALERDLQSARIEAHERTSALQDEILQLKDQLLTKGATGIDLRATQTFPNDGDRSAQTPDISSTYKRSTDAPSLIQGSKRTKIGGYEKPESFMAVTVKNRPIFGSHSAKAASAPIPRWRVDTNQKTPAIPPHLRFTCLTYVTSKEEGHYNTVKANIIPSSVCATVSHLLERLQELRSSGPVPLKMSECIQHGIEIKQGVVTERCTNVIEEGEYAACKGCVLARRPCVRYLEDKRNPTRVYFSKVLVPLPACLRLGKTERDLEFWITASHSSGQSIGVWEA